MDTPEITPDEAPLPKPPEPLRPRRSFARRHPVLLSAFALAGLGAAYFGYLILALPDVSHLRRARPIPTSLMRQRESEARAAGRRPTPPRQSWVPLRSISPVLIQAVLTGEDANFFGHEGFDLREIRESVEKNLERGRFVRGASTITQQLAKNLFLSTEKTLTRKLKEVILTHRLERDLSKSRILELYLNVIEWGEDVYGVEAAAQTYFGKSSSDLDVGEATLLAALIPNPRRLNDENRNKSLKVRQERILNWMLRTGKITEEVYRQAKERTL